ncbi:MAG: MBL fold metallo-hydrolase [Prevotella sp.]|nr:MBL fold metallo-hydrolase [Prevotella sp.]
MLNIKTLVVNQLQENCYIVSDETAEAVIIDCGAFFEQERKAVTNYIRDKGLTLRHHLCTHGHFDHVFGADTIFEEFGLAPEIHQADRYLVEDMDRQFRDMLGEPYPRPSVKVSQLLAEGDTVSFGSHTLKVIYTPGHSEGGLVFYCAEENIAFTGDTIFYMSFGRTDLPGGSWEKLKASLNRLTSIIPPHTILYPGHGPSTTMEAWSWWWATAWK